MRGDAFPIWEGMSSSQMRSFSFLIHDGIDYRWHDTQLPDITTHRLAFPNCVSNTLFTLNEYNILSLSPLDYHWNQIREGRIISHGSSSIDPIQFIIIFIDIYNQINSLLLNNIY